MQKDSQTKIDETDMTILKILLKNARTSYKKIAQTCGISPQAATKRIENLKAKGVITGTRLIHSSNPDYSTTAVVGLKIEENKMLEVKQAIENRIQKGENVMTVYDEGIGYYDAIFGLVAKNMHDIDEIHHFIEGLPGVKGVDIHLWNGRTYFMRDNIALQ